MKNILFTEHKIGGITTANRIVMPPMTRSSALLFQHWIAVSERARLAAGYQLFSPHFLPSYEERR